METIRRILRGLFRAGNVQPGPLASDPRDGLRRDGDSPPLIDVEKHDEQPHRID